MRKRLRKKKRLREFREYGFEIAFGISDRGHWNSVFIAFIEQAIEGNALHFGGSPNGGFAVPQAARASAGEHHRQQVRLWLEGRPEVSNIRIGELRDASHGWGPW